MILANFKPAKNIVLLEAIKARESKSGAIILSQETFVGYYKVVKVGPMCENTKVGDYITSALQMGIEIEFEEGTYMQLPEQGIDGYYEPSKEELENPVPVFTSYPDDEEELNIIDSEDGNNDLGTELGLRED